MTSYEAYLGVGIDASGAQQGASQVNSAMNKIAAAAQKASQEAARLQQQLNYAKLALTAFAAVALRQTIKTISEYGYAMAGLNAVTNATAADMMRLEAVTRQLGASTQFTASQAAEAAKNLGMAGFETNKIIEALPVTLDLAAASAIDMASAASITTGIMAGFQMGADKARGAADILAVIASKAKVDISGMGEALKYVGPIANNLGVDLAETSALLGVLANNGITGGQAGRQLKSAIQGLINPTKGALAELERLNISAASINPRFNSMASILQTLADAGVGAEEAFKIFNATSATAMTILIGSVPQLSELHTAAKNADGAITRMAETMRNTLKGSVDIFWSAVDELMLVLGDLGITGAFVNIIKLSTDLVGWFTELIKTTRQSKEWFGLLKDSMFALSEVLAVLLLMKVGVFFYEIALALKAATAASLLFTGALYGLPLTWVAAGLVALGFAIYKIATNWEYVGEVAHNTIMAMYNGIKRFTAGVILEFGHAANFMVNRLEWVKEFAITASKQAFYSATGQTQKFFAEQARFAEFSKAQWKNAWMTDAERENAIDAMLGVKAKEQVTKAGTELFRAFRDAFKSGALEEYVSGAVANAKSIGETILSAIPKFSGGEVKTKSGDAGGDKKESMMQSELRNMQLAVELAKNLGMAESELYRIRLNAQALQDARENGQKSISATTQKQIEQAVALKAEEDKLTTVYEARKGLDDNLKARLKTAMEAVSVAQNMGASEADLLRMTLESQASEAARKMGLQGINAEMQTMIDKIVTLTGLSAEYKKAYENDKASKDYLQSLQDQLAAEKQRGEFMQKYKGDIAEVDTQMQIYNESKRKDISLTEKQIAKAAELINEKKKLSAEESAAAEASKKAAESQKQWNNQLTYAFKDAIMHSKNLGDALSNLANRVQDMLVNKALDNLLGGLIGGMFAKGAAFQAGGVTAFASGGVVGSPTMFPMRGGKMGLMGEAGAEAIMPLTRTSSGDLGVKAVGAGTVVNTSININVTGGTKEQNEDAGKRVSAAVRQAIDDTVVSVIMREKRPGGVLNAT